MVLTVNSYVDGNGQQIPQPVIPVTFQHMPRMYPQYPIESEFYVMPGQYPPHQEIIYRNMHYQHVADHITPPISSTNTQHSSLQSTAHILKQPTIHEFQHSQENLQRSHEPLQEFPPHNVQHPFLQKSTEPCAQQFQQSLSQNVEQMGKEIHQSNQNLKPQFPADPYPSSAQSVPCQNFNQPSIQIVHESQSLILPQHHATKTFKISSENSTNSIEKTTDFNVPKNEYTLSNNTNTFNSIIDVSQTSNEMPNTACEIESTLSTRKEIVHINGFTKDTPNKRIEPQLKKVLEDIKTTENQSQTSGNSPGKSWASLFNKSATEVSVSTNADVHKAVAVVQQNFRETKEKTSENKKESDHLDNPNYYRMGGK